MVGFLVSIQETITCMSGTLTPLYSRVVFLFLCGYRTQAINIIGEKVMIPRGLVGLGLDTLDQSTKEIHEALSLYADPSALPSIVHCTQGKDRTGKGRQKQTIRFASRLNFAQV